MSGQIVPGPRWIVQPRRGLSRTEAAAYVGVGPTKFDELVKQHRMPQPLKIDGRVLWDIHDLDPAFDALKVGTTANAWDSVA